MATVGVVLSGCGVMDGSEIHEAVVTLLAVDRAGCEALCLAPDMTQADVVDHAAGRAVQESRNVLVEAARIARGRIRDIAAVSAEVLDALILPGGYGAAKNLCDFATRGSRCTARPDVAALLTAIHAAGKPIGAICIAPALVARVLGEFQPLLTIGNDAETAAALEQMGARHQVCPVDDIVIDERNRLVSTPAYMLARSIGETAIGIEKLVSAVVLMARNLVTR